MQVASIVGRAEVVSCIFLTLALLTYSRAMSSGSGSGITSLRRTNWPQLALSIVFSTCSLLSKEQGVMVIGVCASYDIFVHWDELWTIVYNKFRSSSGHAKLEKLETDTDVVQSSDASEDVANNQADQGTKSTPINGMTVRMSNGSSKVKSGTASQSKGQRREAKSIKAAGSTTSLMAVFIRIGSL
jgi:hypothetical protein